MRLIDADALIDLLKKCQKLDWENNIAPISWNHAFANFILIVEEEPTIEAVPVRQGRWINHGSFVTCSVCNEEQYGIDTGRFYCPNCGAKMEAEDETN